MWIGECFAMIVFSDQNSGLLLANEMKSFITVLDGKVNQFKLLWYFITCLFWIFITALNCIKNGNMIYLIKSMFSVFKKKKHTYNLMIHFSIN